MGFSRRLVGPAILWTGLLAPVAAFLAPAVDAHPLPSALWAGAFGLYFGATGWRGLLLLVAAWLGALMGGCVGSLGGVVLAVYIGYWRFGILGEEWWD